MQNSAMLELNAEGDEEGRPTKEEEGDDDIEFLSAVKQQLIYSNNSSVDNAQTEPIAMSQESIASNTTVPREEIRIHDDLEFQSTMVLPQCKVARPDLVIPRVETGTKALHLKSFLNY